MAKYVLSPQAQKSLLQISKYTLDTYGQQQKKIYLKMLRERMRMAAKKPSSGQQRSEIREGYYSIRAERHHVYYRVRDTHIDIIDILHQSMEPKLHL